MSCPFISFAVQPGVRIGDSDGPQAAFFFHDSFTVVGGNILSTVSTIRFAAHQQYCYFQLFDVDQEFPGATG